MTTQESTCMDREEILNKIASIAGPELESLLVRWVFEGAPPLGDTAVCVIARMAERGFGLLVLSPAQVEGWNYHWQTSAWRACFKPSGERFALSDMGWVSWSGDKPLTGAEGKNFSEAVARAALLAILKYQEPAASSAQPALGSATTSEGETRP